MGSCIHLPLFQDKCLLFLESQPKVQGKERRLRGQQT